MKRKILISATGLSVMLLLGACADGNQTVSADAVYVTQVSELLASATLGGINRYAGMIVSQGTKSVEKDANREIDEVLVEVGDTVEEGQVLFTYDLTATEMSIREGELEIERMNNNITSLEKQLADLTAQKEKASANEQLSYSLEIQSVETQIREVQYNVSTKQLEIDNLRKTIDIKEVTAPVAGTIQSIGSSNDSNGDSWGDDSNSNANAYITIMLTGDYRVKGTFNEQNAGEIYEGMNVIIRSRLDENKTWTGIVDMIDYENPVQNNNDYYFSSSSEMTTSSNYPFYISLDSSENLIMGQHVYIEPDYGQTNMQEKEGLWLPEWYIVNNEDGSSYVWAADSADKLEQRAITLGDYDEIACEYEIVEGLAESDYIAFPEDGLEVGNPITTEFIYNEETSFLDEDGVEVDHENFVDENYENFEDINEESSGAEYIENEIIENEMDEEEEIQ